MSKVPLIRSRPVNHEQPKYLALELSRMGDVDRAQLLYSKREAEDWLKRNVKSGYSHRYELFNIGEAVTVHTEQVPLPQQYEERYTIVEGVVSDENSGT